VLLFAAAIIGVTLGSFANVLIVRVPEGREFIRTPSACTSCGERIRWYDNIPVVSYVVLRGRCRDCGHRISARYPVVELVVGALFVAIAAVFGVTWTSGVLGYLAVVSVALVAIDIEHRRLPHALVLPSYGVLAIGVLVGDLVFHEGSLGRAVAGLAILGLFYGLLWFIYPSGMGFGDVTTAGLLGMVLGYLSWAALAVGGIVAPLIAGVVILVGMLAGRVKRKTHIPYGPFLISGAWVGILIGAPIAQEYLELVGVTDSA